MSTFESQKSTVDAVRADPNFPLIAAGALIWFFGYYVAFFRPLIVTGGFLLTCYASAVSALNRPVENAWPGILLGAVLFMAGDVLAVFLPIFAPAAFVTGGVLILFFAIPLAIQRGNAPLAEAMQKVLKASRKKKEKEDKPAKDED